LEQGNTVAELDIPDVYPSTYRFSPDGDKLYVTTASTGKGEQKANLKMDKVLVYDTRNLPEISLFKELDVGIADCGRRPVAYTENNGQTQWVFIPNPTDGTLTIIDGLTDTVADTLTLGEGNIQEVLFSFWNPSIKGC
jgi:DNA-binding beta-propeller fold protein YncE